MRNIRTRAALAATLAAAVVLAALAPAGVAAADPPLASAEAGAAWLAEQLGEGGFITGPSGDPSPSDTVQSALALAAAHTDEAAFDRALGWVGANVEAVVAPGGTDNPGALAYALLLVGTADSDPHDLGGVDLVDRLASTLGTDGMYGGAVDGYDPTYSAVFNQGLAITALVGVDEDVPGEAVEWLTDQQCAADSAAGAVGGWASFRADTSVPCTAPDPVAFSGPDTNSTALALQALAALDVEPGQDALDFLHGTQASDGGFPFITGSGTDPNSTAVVIQAIVATGGDPGSAAWAVGGETPYSSLLSWQITGGDPADEGAFATSFSDGFPDQIATQQAVWGAAGAPFPLPVAFPEPPVTTTTTTTPTTSTVAPSSTTTTTSASSSTTAGAGGTTPVAPRYAG